MSVKNLFLMLTSVCEKESTKAILNRFFNRIKFKSYPEMINDIDDLIFDSPERDEIKNSLWTILATYKGAE